MIESHAIQPAHSRTHTLRTNTTPAPLLRTCRRFGVGWLRSVLAEHLSGTQEGPTCPCSKWTLLFFNPIAPLSRLLRTRKSEATALNPEGANAGSVVVGQERVGFFEKMFGPEFSPRKGVTCRPHAGDTYLGRIKRAPTQLPAFSPYENPASLFRPQNPRWITFS